MLEISKNDITKFLTTKNTLTKEQTTLFVSNLGLILSDEELMEKNPSKTSILRACFESVCYNLSLNKSLGYCYVYPFKKHVKTTDNKGKVSWITICQATFILGYKGLIQLAIRSDEYEKINVISLKQGELISNDLLTEEIIIKYKNDREKLPDIGYMAYLKLKNGFEKKIYWSKNQVISHFEEHSSSYNKQTQSFKISDFESMAKKTVLNQLLKRWGITNSLIKEQVKTIEKINNYEELNDDNFEEVISELKLIANQN